MKFVRRLVSRLRPLGDLTAWVLLVLSVVPLALVDWSLVVTLVQWTAFGVAIAGVSVMLTRILVPQIDLTRWVTMAAAGNVAAGLVVLSVAWLLSFVLLAMVLWAKS